MAVNGLRGKPLDLLQAGFLDLQLLLEITVLQQRFVVQLNANVIQGAVRYNIDLGAPDPAVSAEIWRALLDRGRPQGLLPAGLGARDTLRLEAGLSLYGQDMDEETSPLVSGLGWTVAWEPGEREFIGRQALEDERNRQDREKLVGLILQDRGIMRHGQRVITPAGDGIITSGGFSPTIQRSIALARIPGEATGDCRVEIRNAERRARIVRPPFVRNGRILVDLT